MSSSEANSSIGTDNCSKIIEWDAKSLKVNGERRFFISGEFHYFRVPKKDWRERLRLLKAAGGDCVATYIPWCIHEPEDGKIIFDDCPERDLTAFLETVKEEGLYAIVRPGPYQYSELVYHGLPKWLIDGYPEITKKRPDGTSLRLASVDYNHPYFLERTRTYFKAVADVIRPHMTENGGCIAMVQLDNEMCGIHTWFGYPPSVEYYESCADYLETLRGYLEEFGIHGPYCHNSGGSVMTQHYAPSVKKLGNRDFLLGYDHYYNLSDSFGATHPTLEYFYTALFACDTLKAYGYPPVGLEIQAGTIGDFQPILKEDILACYMANLAAGLKGINYYVFTGGPNFANTGNTCDVYDYSAPIGPDGTVRPTYESLKAFGEFVRSHEELLEAERLSSVNLGFEWTHFAGCAKCDRFFMKAGMFNALIRTPYQPAFLPLEGEIDSSKPLVLAGIDSMSETVQRKVADFVLNGGQLFVMADFPSEDTDGHTCAVLADALGAPAMTPVDFSSRECPVCLYGETRIYGYQPQGKFEALLGNAHVLLTSDDTSSVYGCSWTSGKGQVVQLAVKGGAMFVNQADMIGEIVAGLGAKPVVSSSNRNVMLTAYRLKNGKIGVFALNLHASPQTTVIMVPGGQKLTVDLRSMEVRYYLF